MSTGRAFGLVALAVGLVMASLAEGNVAVLLGAIVVTSVGIGFAVYGDGR